MAAKKPALTLTRKLKDGTEQSIEFFRVKLTGDEVDLCGQPIISMLRSAGGDIEIVHVEYSGRGGFGRHWRAQINNGKTVFQTGSAVKTQRAVLPDIAFYMRAYNGRLR